MKRVDSEQQERSSAVRCGFCAYHKTFVCFIHAKDKGLLTSLGRRETGRECDAKSQLVAGRVAQSHSPTSPPHSPPPPPAEHHTATALLWKLKPLILTRAEHIGSAQAFHYTLTQHHRHTGLQRRRPSEGIKKGKEKRRTHT